MTVQLIDLLRHMTHMEHPEATEDQVDRIAQLTADSMTRAAERRRADYADAMATAEQIVAILAEPKPSSTQGDT